MEINKLYKIKYHYDRDVDVLYASLGNPKAAKTVEKENGIILRIDPDTGQTIGFTVVHYMKRLNAGLLISIPEFENIELPIFI